MLRIRPWSSWRKSPESVGHPRPATAARSFGTGDDIFKVSTEVVQLQKYSIFRKREPGNARPNASGPALSARGTLPGPARPERCC